MMKKPTKILAFTLCILLLGGCGWLSPFKQNIQQGNILDEEAVTQLATGMTEEQVLYLLGTPLLKAPDDPTRWNYVYQVRRGETLLERKDLKLEFAPGPQGRLVLKNIQQQP